MQLNLPSYEFQFRNDGQSKQIFDSLRKRFVELTPEEWVRQHFIRFLVEEKKYPASLISVEHGLKVSGMQKRTDLVVYSRSGKPMMIVECKAPEVEINEDTLFQAARYNMTLKADFLVLTNGMEHYCLRMLENNFEYLEDLPSHY